MLSLENAVEDSKISWHRNLHDEVEKVFYSSSAPHKETNLKVSKNKYLKGFTTQDINFTFGTKVQQKHILSPLGSQVTNERVSATIFLPYTFETDLLGLLKPRSCWSSSAWCW